MKELEIPKGLDEKVWKHNDLIQKVKFNLSEQEQKIIAFMCTRIKPADERLNFVAFRLDDFYDLCGRKGEGGAARRYLKNTLKALSDKPGSCGAPLTLSPVSRK